MHMHQPFREQKEKVPAHRFWAIGRSQDDRTFNTSIYCRYQLLFNSSVALTAVAGQKHVATSPMGARASFGECLHFDRFSFTLCLLS